MHGNVGILCIYETFSPKDAKDDGSKTFRIEEVRILGEMYYVERVN